MLGLSMTKILFTLAVVVLVWLAFRWVKRARTIGAQAAAARRGVGRHGSAAARRAAADAAESFVACRVCGTYVAARGSRSCGRADCPYT